MTAAVLVGLAFPALFGAVEGVIISRLRRRPVAALGLLLTVMDAAAPNGGGTIRLYNNVLIDIEGGAMSPAVGWIIMGVAVILAGGLFLVRDTRRRSSGLAAPPSA